MASCPHILPSFISEIRASSKVYKEECTACFKNIDSDKGINVCLTCFNASCFQTHTQTHFKKTKHPLLLNLTRSKKIKSRENSTAQPPAKITKLEIKEAPSDEELYDIHSKVICIPCNITLDSSLDLLSNATKAVLNAMSAKKANEVKAWSEELTSCSHTEKLVQPDTSSTSAALSKNCAKCDLKENLWLCLTCGKLGCGRQQYGGTGGNGHGLVHYEETDHPVAVKLGTITAEGGGDIFCYKCGEERIDKQLGKHLSHFGIAIASVEKTEKSLTELQLEQNLKFDFSMTTQDGKSFESLFGPGFTGLKNLGNTCYMASVLQTLFSFPEFIHRYNKSTHFETCTISNPADCFLCQMTKMCLGLTSGDYSIPLHDDEGKERGQDGVSPSMFKDLIGKGHAEFSTMRQQDAQDYLSHLLTLIEQKERTLPTVPVSKLFEIQLEQRMQCRGDCGRVKYASEKDIGLHLFIPGNKEEITLEECLREGFFKGSFGEGWNCPTCLKKTTLERKSRFIQYPTYLVCIMKRFIVGDDYVMKKLNTKIKAPMRLNLDEFRARGIQPSETLLPTTAPTAEPEFNQTVVEQLMMMGFSDIRAKKACLATGGMNSNADSAMSWLFEHMEDPGINDPIPSSTSGGNDMDIVYDEAQIGNLMDMGFSIGQAKKAIKETGGNMERAVDWLFSHSGENSDDEEPASTTTTDASPVIDTAPANYKLVSFVSHKGTSTACGHYVSHIYNEDKKCWVLFNDNKVAKVPKDNVNESVGAAYMYFYKKI